MAWSVALESYFPFLPFSVPLDVLYPILVLLENLQLSHQTYCLMQYIYIYVYYLFDTLCLWTTSYASKNNFWLFLKFTLLLYVIKRDREGLFLHLSKLLPLDLSPPLSLALPVSLFLEEKNPPPIAFTRVQVASCLLILSENHGYLSASFLSATNLSW